MNLLISTGDYSGDFVGSLLANKIRQFSRDTHIYAIGGEKLKAAGAEVLQDSSDWSTIGIFDSLKKIPQVYRAYFDIKKKLDGISLDGIVYIDCPAFNVRFAKALAPRKIRSVYFFPPSGWARDLKKAAEVGQWVNLVIAPFQSTAEVYVAAGVPTYFSGHPVLDLVHPQGDVNKMRRESNLDPRNPVMGIFPGSRDQEMHYVLPLQLDAVEFMLSRMRHVQFLLPIARQALAPLILDEIRKRKLPIQATIGSNYRIMEMSDFLILTSGTATLEAALFEKPMLITYRVSPWSWKLERPFLKGVRYAGLPNLLAGREIVPEFLQDGATPENLALTAIDFLRHDEKREKMTKNLRSIRPMLGEPGAIERVTKLILETFRG